MNREQSQLWLETMLGVSRETIPLLSAVEKFVVAANAEQNLIAKSTIADFWSRHIVDSAQLLPLSTDVPGTWLDLGSGAGFPGIVIALLTERHVVLAEERRKRVEHLRAMVSHFDLSNRVSVLQGRVEQQAAEPFAVISARAFAPLDRLFTMAHYLSSKKTLWLLPKGKSAASELEAAQRTWQGSFRIVPSVTDPDGAIIIATDVQPRRRR